MKFVDKAKNFKFLSFDERIGHISSLLHPTANCQTFCLVQRLSSMYVSLTWIVIVQSQYFMLFTYLILVPQQVMQVDMFYFFVMTRNLLVYQGLLTFLPPILSSLLALSITLLRISVSSRIAEV